jgi:hypothetical protein
MTKKFVIEMVIVIVCIGFAYLEGRFQLIEKLIAFIKKIKGGK